jgi:hypothetical protein
MPCPECSQPPVLNCVPVRLYSESAEHHTRKQDQETGKECLEAVIADHRDRHMSVRTNNARITRKTESTKASCEGGVRFIA